MANGVIEDVIIIDATKDGKSRVISAGEAYLLDRGDEAGVLSLMLGEVFTQESDPSQPERFEYSTAERMEYNILLTSFADLSAGVSPREMSSVDVAKAIGRKEAGLEAKRQARGAELEAKRSALAADYLVRSVPGARLDSSMARLKPAKDSLVALAAKPLKDRSLDIYRLEYYKKFSIPAGALCFVFLAFPLGARAKKSGRAVGFGIGLLVAVAYWALLIGGQTLGLRTGFDPFLSMWAPNILVLAAAVPLLLVRRSA